MQAKCLHIIVINHVDTKVQQVFTFFLLTGDKGADIKFQLIQNCFIYNTGTRSIEVSNENLRTIEKYALFRHLIDSTGIVDEAVLDKLKLNIRSLIASQEEDSKDLLDLCIDVIYHNNMKAFGLQQLIKLYLTWLSSPEAEEEEE